MSESPKIHADGVDAGAGHAGSEPPRPDAVSPYVLIPPEDRYHALFATSREGIAYVHMNGRILEANPAYQKLLGYTLEELRELSYQQITPPHGPSRLAASAIDFAVRAL